MLKLILNHYRISWKTNPFANVSFFAIYACFYAFYQSRDFILGRFPSFMVLLSLFTISLFPNRILKGVYLCPVSMEEREKLIKTGIMLKTCILLVIYIIGSILSCLILGFPPIAIVFGFFYYLFINLMINFQSIGFVLPKKSNTQNLRDTLDLIYRLPKERNFSLLCSICLLLAMVVYIFSQHFTGGEILLHLIFLSISTILVVIYVKKYAKYMIRICANYQATYTPTTTRLRGPGE